MSDTAVTENQSRDLAAEQWDAIVVGGGHNGLTAAAYLAKAGMRTLVLEQRHLVGGAAITEELRPGFSFTTFSYALSLLRPEIIHELDLVEHGFLPLMMPSSFHPTGDGDYLLFGDDTDQNLQMIRRHSRHDADAYLRFNHDVDQVVPARRDGQDVGAHRLGAAGDLVGRLAFGAQGDQESGDLRLCRLAGHDP